MNDPQSPRPPAVQYPWESTSDELAEANRHRPGVRLLAETHGELLSLDLAEVDGDANLIPGSIQGHVDVEEPPNSTAAQDSGDGERSPASNRQMK